MSPTRKLTGDPFGIPGYKLIRRVNRSAETEVWAASEVRTDRKVAIKVLCSDEDADISRFHREITALAGLHNTPNVATLLGSGDTDSGHLWFAVPWYEATLEDFRGRVSWQQLARVGMGLCQALGAAHELDIVHRDLKPANVMVTVLRNGDPCPYLADFGIAKIRGKATTSPQELRGTLPFIAPERFSHVGETGNEKSDVYALAGTLYTLYLGTVPIASDVDLDGLSYMDAMVLTVNEQAPRLPDFSVPAAIVDLIDEGLRKDPEQRPTIDEFHDRLAAALTNNSAVAQTAANPTLPPAAVDTTPRVAEPAVEIPVPTPPRTPKKKHRSAVVSAVIGVLALVAVVGFWDPITETVTGAHPTNRNGTTSTSSPSVTVTTQFRSPVVPTPTTLSKAAAWTQAAGTLQGVANDDPRVRIALFQGANPTEVCAVGHIDRGLLGPSHLNVWQERNRLVDPSTYSHTPPDTGSVSLNAVNGAWSYACFPQYCDDGNNKSSRSCTAQPIRRFVFQAYNDAGVMYRTALEIGENRVSGLPDHATYLALKGSTADGTYDPYYLP